MKTILKHRLVVRRFKTPNACNKHMNFDDFFFAIRRISRPNRTKTNHWKSTEVLFRCHFLCIYSTASFFIAQSFLLNVILLNCVFAEPIYIRSSYTVAIYKSSAHEKNGEKKKEISQQQQRVKWLQCTCKVKLSVKYGGKYTVFCSWTFFFAEI